MEVYEFEAKTIEETIKIACETLKCKKEDLEIEIISRGSSGLLGIVGQKNAKIKVIPKKTKQEAINLAQEILKKLLSYFPLPTKIETQTTPTEVRLNIRGDECGILIGKSGQTLIALEHILQKMVQKQWKANLPIKLILDIEGYKKKRVYSLIKLAQRLAAQAKKTATTLSTFPLPPDERKIIHTTLQKNSAVKTKSIGEGELKHVNIIPIKQKNNQLNKDK
jgi:spoIIIJ-associated protein